MREIIFRGKAIDKDTDKWVFGDLFHNLFDEGSPTIFSRNSGHWPIVPETVGQYIGLCDTEGNKIFEGDIVEFTYHPTPDPEWVKEIEPKEPWWRKGGKVLSRVSFYDGGFWLKCISSFMPEEVGTEAPAAQLVFQERHPEFRDFGFNVTHKVIGNIYDNPELLK